MAVAVVVLGTPGVGKSELARGLGGQIGLEVIDLSRLVKKKRLYKRFDKRTRSFEVDERRVRDYLRTRIEEKGVVIATHFIGKSIPKGRVRLAIVLRLDPVTLYRRLRARRWTRQKAWENVESELVDVCLEEAVRLLGRDRVVEIDTTSLTPAKVLLRALDEVSVKRKPFRYRVDWLSVYDPLELEKKLRWKNSTS